MEKRSNLIDTKETIDKGSKWTTLFVIQGCLRKGHLKTFEALGLSRWGPTSKIVFLNKYFRFVEELRFLEICIVFWGFWG